MLVGIKDLLVGLNNMLFEGNDLLFGEPNKKRSRYERPLHRYKSWHQNDRNNSCFSDSQPIYAANLVLVAGNDM